MNRRLLIGGVMATLLLAFSAPVAGAFPPTHGPTDYGASYLTDNLCPFTVEASSRLVGQYTVFFDAAGNTTKWIEQDVEQDTFSANGKTLVGEPFHVVGELTFDADGNMVSYHAMGGVERVRLPDGSMFWSAGRFDWLGHPGVTFTIVPDNGHSGNVEAFCAALT